MNLPPPVIRPADEADLPAVLRLYAQPSIDDGQVLGPTEAAAFLRRMRSYPFYVLYVAVRDGSVVGSFALLIMDNLAHLGAPSGVVEDVVVDPERHGEGIGSAMMRFAMEACRDRGCYKMALSANRKRAGAHRFYESLGFERHGYSYVVSLEVAPPPGR